MDYNKIVKAASVLPRKDRIKLLLGLAGLCQQDVANSLDVTRSFVNQVIHGKCINRRVENRVGHMLDLKGINIKTEELWKP